jgi:hypothetical protein
MSGMEQVLEAREEAASAAISSRAAGVVADSIGGEDAAQLDVDTATAATAATTATLAGGSQGGGGALKWYVLVSGSVLCAFLLSARVLPAPRHRETQPEPERDEKRGTPSEGQQALAQHATLPPSAGMAAHELPAVAIRNDNDGGNHALPATGIQQHTLPAAGTQQSRYCSNSNLPPPAAFHSDGEGRGGDEAAAEEEELFNHCKKDRKRHAHSYNALPLAHSYKALAEAGGAGRSQSPCKGRPAAARRAVTGVGAPPRTPSLSVRPGWAVCVMPEGGRREAGWEEGRRGSR